MSDKAFRKTKENIFEAIGNVVITHKEKNIYGEKAVVSFETGEVKVIGNVRYIGPEMTLYGTELNFNFKNGELIVQNARIQSDNYIVLGKEIKKVDKNILVAKDAEYTTCKDCPESWSFFGNEVTIVLGEYVYIKNAFIKAKGVVIFYFPYIVFPIKKKRETGLLFPHFGFGLEDGVLFQQPWFWAISDYNDLTLTPSIFGKRGTGSEFQFRQNLGDKKWMEIDTLTTYDRIYTPGKKDFSVSGEHYFRLFGNYEHHFSFGHYFNHHLNYTYLRDLDMVRDFDDYSNHWIEGPEVYRGGFFEFRQPLLNFEVESYVNQNLLIEESRGFDHSYVQILPKVSFDMNPYSLYKGSFFPIDNLTLGINGDVTKFKQNHKDEGVFIRNAERLNLSPSLNWSLGSLGPLEFNTQATFDYQHYRFPYEDEKTFSKKGIAYETEIKTEIQRVYGMSYRRMVPTKSVVKKETNEVVDDKSTSSLIGDIPNFDSYLNKDTVEIIRNSYRHSQVFKLKHYFLSDQTASGNTKFLEQIKEDRGLFDTTDALRDEEHNLNNAQSKNGIPLKNTVEFQWNNTVIKKEPTVFDPYKNGRYLRDNFDYKSMAYFNLSQGYKLYEKSPNLIDSLTRLNASGGYELSQFNLSFSESYFYVEHGHIFNLNLSHGFSIFNYGGRILYDSFSIPYQRSGSFNFGVTPIPTVTLGLAHDYSWDQKRSIGSNYNVIYRPTNNCWILDLKYKINRIDKSLSFNFMINFNENNFTSLAGQGYN